jgi:4-hydroxybenzoate polyprenyltransferase
MKNNYHSKKILILHTLITLFITFMIILSFLLNLKEFYIYFLYIIISLILFITIFLVKKIILQKELKEYFKKCQSLMMYSFILFILALIFMLIDLLFLLYPIIFVNSFIFSMGFLKITMIGLIIKKGKLK